MNVQRKNTDFSMLFATRMIKPIVKKEGGKQIFKKQEKRTKMSVAIRRKEEELRQPLTDKAETQLHTFGTAKRRKTREKD